MIQLSRPRRSSVSKHKELVLIIRTGWGQKFNEWRIGWQRSNRYSYIQIWQKVHEHCIEGNVNEDAGLYFHIQDGTQRLHRTTVIMRGENHPLTRLLDKRKVRDAFWASRIRASVVSMRQESQNLRPRRERWWQCIWICKTGGYDDIACCILRTTNTLDTPDWAVRANVEKCEALLGDGWMEEEISIPWKWISCQAYAKPLRHAASSDVIGANPGVQPGRRILIGPSASKDQNCQKIYHISSIMTA